MVYKKGKTQKSLSYFANGNKQSIGGYVMNKKQGTWTYFSPDGSEIFSGNYMSGQKKLANGSENSEIQAKWL